MLYSIIEMNIWKGKKIHFIGIKGAGMSGLSQLLKKEGAVVFGSDTREVFPSETILRKEGIAVRDFSEDNISKDIDLIVYSSAYGEEHPERAKAGILGIKEMSYAEALAKYADDKQVIVVTGTHGKTTTTALLGQIFEAAGLDPAVLVGDIVKAWENSVRLPAGQAGSGRGDFFIVEGDEYQEKFRLFKPVGVVIPSLDWDHPDYFKTREDYLNSFESWLEKNQQAKVVRDFEETDEKIFEKANFILPGKHYRRNCLLAIRLARLFEIDAEKIIKGINAFQGVVRRLDFYTPEDSEILIIYDYAHHPEEIRATLEALSEKYPNYKLIAVFQPHTFSRTEVFLEDFAKSFSKAEAVFFEEIYASAREKPGEINLEHLIAETKKFHKQVFRLQSLEALLSFAKRHDRPLLIFMGAGDIWQKAKSLSSLLFGEKGGFD